MNKQTAAAFEAQVMMEAIPDLERRVRNLKDTIGGISKTNEDLRNDPRQAMVRMKAEQLQKALEAYGKVDLSQTDLERIPMIFARLQADEAAARNDIANLNQLVEGEKHLKKQLEIAKAVLAEKIQPGGRA